VDIYSGIKIIVHNAGNILYQSVNAHAVKMAADQEVKKKKERDPILTVGFVVLIVAFASVIGIFINDEYLSSTENTPAKTGDLVYVNYTGSYYTYYDGDGAVIFDTSLWSVADNDDFQKSFEFSLRSESQYIPLSFTIGGSDNLLQRFKDAAIGLLPGETSTVRISPEDGYGALTKSNTTMIRNEDLSKGVTETIPKADFESFYGITGLEGNKTNLPSPYGWFIDASCPSGSTFVTVSHRVVEGKTYTLNADVGIEVTKVTSDGFEYRYVFNGLTAAPVDDQTVSDDLANRLGCAGSVESVKLVKIIYNEKSYFLAAVDDVDAPMELVMKNSDSNNRETVGMYLYFAITRV
jgi:FKBP-type peptidyl-prolyl cis-trans isomerases 2